jgi:hypothetical protein
MDDRLRAKCLELRKMTSNQAANWLIESYPVGDPDYGEAIQLLPHRSWKRADQIRLARYYLEKMPFASSRIYEVFASFMSLDVFLRVIRDHLARKTVDMDLLLYHLRPVLDRAVRTDQDRELLATFPIERTGRTVDCAN